MEAECKDGVRGDGVASLIVAAREKRGSLGVGFENMMRSEKKSSSRRTQHDPLP